MTAMQKMVTNKEILTHDHVLKHAMLEHLRATADLGAVYSMPRSSLSVETMTGLLGEAETVAHANRLHLQEAEADAGLSADAEGQGDLDVGGAANTSGTGAAEDELLFFKLRDLQVGSRKLKRVSVAAGRPLQASHFAMTVHERMPGTSGHSAQVYSKKLSHSSRLPDVVALLTGIEDVNRTLEIQRWEARSCDLRYLGPRVRCFPTPMHTSRVTGAGGQGPGNVLNSGPMWSVWGHEGKEGK